MSSPEELRSKILELTKAYFDAAHGPKPFNPGETYVPSSGKVCTADDLQSLVDASLDLWLTAGRFASKLEGELSPLMGRRGKCLLVNSGSSANLVATSSLGSPLLKQFDLKPLEKGAEVITVAAGFPTTVNPIIQNGWTPVFVDIDASTLNVIPEKIMAARTPKTRAVIVAHTLGNPYRADVIEKWCQKEGLYFIEDCCDALGAEIKTADGIRRVGSFGDYAALSFYPAHHITMGEGGAVFPRNGKFRRVAEGIRDWGRDCWCEPGKDNTCGKRFDWQLGDLPQGYDHKYTYSSIGYNLKVTDMQAAIGLSQLKKVDGFVAARRKNWATLHAGISQSPVLRERLLPTQATPETNPSWFAFPMLTAPGINRHALLQKLEERKVATRLVFAGNLTKQPAYQGAHYRIEGELTQTDEVMNRGFWLGVYPGLTDKHLNYVLETLESVLKSI